MSDLILGAFMARRVDPDRRRDRDQADRLAVLARLPAAARVPRPQPDALPVDRPRGRTTRRRHCSAASRIEPDETPVVIAGGGEILRNPTNAELGRAIGLGSRRQRPRRSATSWSSAPGPPGSRPRSTPLPRGSTSRESRRSRRGGQAGTSARIENYLGFPAGVSGSELTQRACVQAGKFGARLTVPAAAAVAAQRAGPA